MNTLIVSTFDCSFEDFDKFVADFHEKEGHKYVEEYELIKVNEHKSHLILKVKDLEGFAAATSTPEMLMAAELLDDYLLDKRFMRELEEEEYDAA